MIVLPPSDPVRIEVRDDLRVLVAVMLKEAPGCPADIAESLGAPLPLVMDELRALVAAGAAEAVGEPATRWYRAIG